jgi:hypothetical protein
MLTSNTHSTNFAQSYDKEAQLAGLSRETRLQIMLNQDELSAIDDWRFKRRMPSRASAIRELLMLGLRAALAGTADPSMRSQDFGVLREPATENGDNNGRNRRAMRD